MTNLNHKTHNVVVIGAGVGGLTTATILAKHGLDVTVLEQQVYPGGCAGTFFHKGYRFDAGATLAAGFYPGGPMPMVAEATGATWPTEPASGTAIAVHLPDGSVFHRPVGDGEVEAAAQMFGKSGERFFAWQQATADRMWDLAMTLPSWPPQSVTNLIGNLIPKAAQWFLRNPSMTGFVDAFLPVSAHLPKHDDILRLLVDGQLLISAQQTSDKVNALYGASALDLPRRGVAHLRGGMGAISQGLAQALGNAGGTLRYRQKVSRIERLPGGSSMVHTHRGEIYHADIVIANLTPYDLGPLLGDMRTKMPHGIANGFGAFVLHVGARDHPNWARLPLHQQVLRKRPLGEGNSVFVSISDVKDSSRAPHGHRAITISTHTNLAKWWHWDQTDPNRYAEEKQKLATIMLEHSEWALPNLRQQAQLVMPGTPITYQRYTGRAFGWVGGYPQTSLLSSRGAKAGKNLWLVGDSIFPGQSTAAVALGAMRVANEIIKDINYKR